MVESEPTFFKDEDPEDAEFDIKDSILKLASTDFTYNESDEEGGEMSASALRRDASGVEFSEQYPGVPVTRREVEVAWGTRRSDESEGGSSNEGESVGSEEEGDLEEDQLGEEEVEEEEDGDTLSESEIEDDDDGENSYDMGIEEFSSKLQKPKSAEASSKGFEIFSSSAKDTGQDIERGKAIRNQLSIWEQLLECRIKLQKGLLASNRLYQTEDYREFRKGLEPDEEAVVAKTYTGLMELMETLLLLQESMSKQCIGEDKMLKRSSDSPLEDDDVKRPKIRKLEDVGEELKKFFAESKPYRDTEIEKWGDKSRVMSGRLGAGQTSTLVQIEQILCDKERLLRRTRVKRSSYQVLGKQSVQKESTSEEVDETKGGAGPNEYDAEIFDDDDFYHKLLRDFVERKTSEVSDPTQLGRRWVELQKLRSKMKRKIDVRATKGRRLRFTVHNRLVNFMAPVPFRIGGWTEENKDRLFRSLFGKACGRTSGSTAA